MWDRLDVESHLFFVLFLEKWRNLKEQFRKSKIVCLCRPSLPHSSIPKLSRTAFESAVFPPQLFMVVEMMARVPPAS